jgi:hypothetical protein
MAKHYQMMVALNCYGNTIVITIWGLTALA